MFIVAIFLIALGYSTLYYGGSMGKTYKLESNRSKYGGIPFGYLIGFPVDKSNPPQSRPPFNWDPTNEEVKTSPPVMSGR